MTDRSARLSRAQTVERLVIGTRLWATEAVSMRLTVRARLRLVGLAPCSCDLGWSTAAALAETRMMAGARIGVAAGSAAMTANGGATRMAEAARFLFGYAEVLAVVDSTVWCWLVGARIGPNVSATDTEAQTLEETEPATSTMPWCATVRKIEMVAIVRGKTGPTKGALFTLAAAPFRATPWLRSGRRKRRRRTSEHRRRRLLWTQPRRARHFPARCGPGAARRRR